MKLELLIEKEREKLHKLIKQNADKKDILKQSQLLDKLIMEKMRQ